MTAVDNSTDLTRLMAALVVLALIGLAAPAMAQDTQVGGDDTRSLASDDDDEAVARMVEPLVGPTSLGLRVRF